MLKTIVLSVYYGPVSFLSYLSCTVLIKVLPPSLNSSIFLDPWLIFSILFYSIALVFFGKDFDFINFLRANDALSDFIILIPISLAQSLVLLSTAPKY